MIISEINLRANMKVIVNNFFDGILKRGIPIYTSELVQKLRDNNVQVIYVA
ncbi:glycosyl transferase family 1, partial [Escherichia coli]